MRYHAEARVNHQTNPVGAGEMFVEWGEKKGIPSLGFSGQGDRRAFQKRETALRAKNATRGIERWRFGLY